MTCCDIKLPPKLLKQEISSSDKKFLPVTIFLWQEMFYYGTKFLSMARNFLVWQEILPVARHLFVTIVLHENNVLLPKRKFLLQETIGLTWTFCIIWQEISSCQSCAKGEWISADFSWEPEDFVGAWLPGSPGISHPDYHNPGGEERV